MADLTRTLLPVVTDTVSTRTHTDSSTDETLVTERQYQLEDADQVWLGLSSLTVQRGDRYSGTEQTLRVSNYSGDSFRSAILQMVREQKRNATDQSSDYCKERAASFLADLKALLAD